MNISSLDKLMLQTPPPPPPPPHLPHHLSTEPGQHIEALSSFHFQPSFRTLVSEPNIQQPSTQLLNFYFYKNIEDTFNVKLSKSKKMKQFKINRNFLDIRKSLWAFNYIKCKEKFITEQHKQPILLYVYVITDGHGDFNWIDTYIKLFKKLGYVNDNIIIVIQFETEFYNLFINYKNLRFQTNFQNFLDYLDQKIQDLELNNILNSRAFRELSNLKFDLDKHKYISFIRAIQIIFHTIKEHNMHELIEQDNTINLREKKLFIKFINDILYWISLLESYIEYNFYLQIDVNDNKVEYFNILDDSENDEYYDRKYPREKIIDTEDEECESITYERPYEKIFPNKKFKYCHHDIEPIVISFSFEHFNIEHKYIAMAEGGCNYEEHFKFICSGVGDLFIGLYNPLDFHTLLLNKHQLLNIMNVRNILEQVNALNDITTIQYNYAYISKNRNGGVYSPQNKLYSYMFLLLCLLKKQNISERILFISDALNKIKIIDNEKYLRVYFKNYNKIQIYFYSKNLFTLTYNNVKLICSIFSRLDKNDFLTLINYSEMCNFSTGDLSAHETLMMGKFCMHDYMTHKRRFYNFIIEHLVNFTQLDRPYLLNIQKYLTNAAFNNLQYQFIKSTITNIILIFIKKFDSFHQNILLPHYNFNNNFLILLVFIYCIKFNLTLGPEIEKTKLKKLKYTKYPNLNLSEVLAVSQDIVKVENYCNSNSHLNKQSEVNMQNFYDYIYCYFTTKQSLDRVKCKYVKYKIKYNKIKNILKLK